MANCYTLTTPKISLRATDDQIEKLREAFDDEDESGMTVRWHDNQVWLSHDESACPESLNERQLEAIAEIIRSNGLGYWEFGVAYVSDRCAPGEFDGGRFRITDDGRLQFADFVWPEGETPPIEPDRLLTHKGDIYDSIILMETSKELWDRLVGIFESDNELFVGRMACRNHPDVLLFDLREAREIFESLDGGVGLTIADYADFSRFSSRLIEELKAAACLWKAPFLGFIVYEP
jgi:hypothetical protein